MLVLWVIDLDASHLHLVVRSFHGILVRAEWHKLLRRAAAAGEHLAVEFHDGLGRCELEDYILCGACLLDYGLHLAGNQFQDICLAGKQGGLEIIFRENSELRVSYGEPLCCFYIISEAQSCG